MRCWVYSHCQEYDVSRVINYFQTSDDKKGLHHHAYDAVAAVHCHTYYAELYHMHLSMQESNPEP